MNIFKEASREKLRFNFKGLISVEDLWDLPLSQLDSLYKEIESKNENKSKGLIKDRPTKEEKLDSLKLEIIKDIFTVKSIEIEARKKAIEAKRKKQRIMELIEKKEDEALSEKSTDELRKLLEESDKT